MTFVGALVLMFTINVPLALITCRAAADRVAHAPLRRAHDPHLAPALPARRGLQRPHRGERRRHPRGAGLRQRGARAAPLRGDNAAYRSTKLDAYRYMAASISLSYLGMRLTHVVVLVAGSYFVMSGASRPAASSASCCWSTSSTGRSRRSTR
jgi:ATP-binding cassette, subfamily B, bacterial